MDSNLNHDVGPISTQEADSLPNDNSFNLDQNLNLTLSRKSSPGPLLQPTAVRPPSLSVLSPLNRPDPSEVDDEAPVTSDSSPDSNSILSHDTYMDPDLLNGNVTFGTVLSNSKLTCENNSPIITWVKQKTRI